MTSLLATALPCCRQATRSDHSRQQQNQLGWLPAPQRQVDHSPEQALQPAAWRPHDACGWRCHSTPLLAAPPHQSGLQGSWSCSRGKSRHVNSKPTSQTQTTDPSLCRCVGKARPTPQAANPELVTRSAASAAGHVPSCLAAAPPGMPQGMVWALAGVLRSRQDISEPQPAQLLHTVSGWQPPGAYGDPAAAAAIPRDATSTATISLVHPRTLRPE
jgi:hypothetical protein